MHSSQTADDLHSSQTAEDLTPQWHCFPKSRRQPAFLPGHYEHGFDSVIVAPKSKYSLFLKGGNDSNFGMALKLPTTPNDAVDLPPNAESEDPSVFDGQFKPDSVSFYVRTDNEKADAGHFILGESNEVNKRVAQFQFTKDGQMGLLGTGGATHGATPYVPNRWYLVQLRFDWLKKEVQPFVFAHAIAFPPPGTWSIASPLTGGFFCGRQAAAATHPFQA